MRFFRLFIFPICFLAACLEKPGVKKSGNTFDLGRYFSQHARELTFRKTTIQKLTEENGHQQVRRIRQPDWESELALFAQSAIDKPAWKNSYLLTSKGNIRRWTANDPSLRTRSVLVENDAEGHTRKIEIHNLTRNFLYRSEERLTWVTDSGYVIVKDQKVRFLSANHYRVCGKFF